MLDAGTLAAAQALAAKSVAAGATTPAKFKVAPALLRLARRSTGSAEVAVSPAELSSRVGLDVDTVRRNVQRLREQEYVRIVGERVEIPDVEALRKLVQLLGTKDELVGDPGAR